MRSWNNRDLLPFGALLLLGACTRRAPAPGLEAAAPPAWNWVDFPRSERLVLAPLSAVIEPARMESLKAPREGWFLPEPAFAGAGGKDVSVAAGQMIGRMAPGAESFDAQSEAMHKDITDVEEKLRLLHEEEARESFAEQERQARREISTYEAALSLNADPAIRRDILPQAADASRKEIERLTERLEAARKRLQEIHATGERQAALKRRQTELADAKAAFERGQKTGRDAVKAPFAGRLRLAVSLEAAAAETKNTSEGAAAAPPAAASEVPAGPRAYVRVDEMLAVVRDDTALWAKVEIAEASLLSVPADQLLFAFTAAGEPVEAPFGGRAPDNAVGAPRSSPVYQFKVAEASPRQALLVGGVVAGQLVQKLPQPAYVVPKIRLQLHRSGAFSGGDWAADCARVFPGCRVLAVGRDAVAVVPGSAEDAQKAPAGGGEDK